MTTIGEVRAMRARYVLAVRDAYRQADAELEAIFQGEHVEPPRFDQRGGEYDPVRSASPACRAALYGHPDASRSPADVWLACVAPRLQGEATIDDAVDTIERLVAARATFGRAAKVGASQETIREAAAQLASCGEESDLIHILFAGTPAEAARNLAMTRTADVLYAEMVCPRLANSDPALVAAAGDAAARMAAAEEVLEQTRAERDQTLVILRQAGWGYDRIARALSMSKQRVVQLCRGIRPTVEAGSADDEPF